MAHAAAHIKKARSEMDQPPDLKALEKARERKRRSRERAERKRKVPGQTGDDSLTHPFIHSFSTLREQSVCECLVHPASSHPITSSSSLPLWTEQDWMAAEKSLCSIIKDSTCLHGFHLHLHLHLLFSVFLGSVFHGIAMFPSTHFKYNKR